MICSVSCGTIKSFTETFFMQGQTSHLASPLPPPGGNWRILSFIISFKWGTSSEQFYEL